MAFQLSTTNQPVVDPKETSATVVDWRQSSLLSCSESGKQPRPLLTEASYIWLPIFNFVKPTPQRCPGCKFSSNTLKNYGFANNVPSILHRPQLSCGHHVSPVVKQHSCTLVDRLKYLWKHLAPNRGLCLPCFLTTFNLLLEQRSSPCAMMLGLDSSSQVAL